MSFFDWNNDGKKDFTDNFIECNIYKDVQKNGSRPQSSGSSTKFWVVLLVILFICRLYSELS